MSELFSSEKPPSPKKGTPASPKGKEEIAPAYRVLARKYRPSSFAELIGQETVVRTLTNAISTNRLPQAWMLTGVRGVGKTTTARLIARALNCTGADGKGGPTIDPCGVCDACRAIAEDRDVDVIEMDAASRTGVDDIRDIVDGVRYGPMAARYKIYILDEVHMLSKNAFNALLKTLEEPPPHTKFIFATTEIRKVPVTVLSRCQRFDLRRIDSVTLTRHFAMIAEKEQATFEPEAIRLIAHAADGSVRDGLSLLDQAIARGDGKIATLDVKDMLGLADRAQSLQLGQHVLRGTMREALDTYNTLVQAGADPLQVLQDLSELVHLLTRAQIIPDLVKGEGLAETDRAVVAELADISIPALARAWQILLKGLGEVQHAPHPAQAAEMVLIRLAYAAELPPPADLVRQIKEQGASAIASTPSASPSGGGARAYASQTVRAVQRAEPVVKRVAAQPETVGPDPATFREVVALFEENREGALVAQLRSEVHPVRCEPGLLEVRLNAGAVTDLINRVSMGLNKWTARRWVVSVSSAEGAPTLLEEDQAIQRKREEKIDSHPLMKAMKATFPEAKILNFRQKVARFVPAGQDAPVRDDDWGGDAAETLSPSSDLED